MGSSSDNDWNIICPINPSEKEVLLKLVIVPHLSSSAGLESQHREGGWCHPFYSHVVLEDQCEMISPVLSQIPWFNRMPRAPCTVTFPHTDQNECSLETPSDMPGSWAQERDISEQQRASPGRCGMKGLSKQVHLHSCDVAKCSVFCRNT